MYSLPFLSTLNLRGLQPGQYYAIYHVRCSVVTRGHFFLPSRMNSQTLPSTSRPAMRPFAHTRLWGSWESMLRAQASTPDYEASPISHLYLVTLGLLLTERDPEDEDDQVLGLSERSLT